MPTVPFCLQPFDPDPALAGLVLDGAYSLEQGHLRIHYRLCGNLEVLKLPCPAPRHNAAMSSGNPPASRPSWAWPAARATGN